MSLSPISAGLSIATLAGAPLISGAQSALQNILIRPYRGILPKGGSMITPDCSIEEVSRDDLQITEHPVEEGSVINDHAFRRPAEITLRWAWTNAGKFDLGEGFSKQMYANLRKLQGPPAMGFDLFTGKRTYKNMLIASLGITTNNTSEYSLMVVAVCREIIIAKTQVQKSVSKEDHKDPSKTAPTEKSGDKQAAQAGSARSSDSGTGAGLDPAKLSFQAVGGDQPAPVSPESGTVAAETGSPPPPPPPSGLGPGDTPVASNPGTNSSGGGTGLGTGVPASAGLPAQPASFA